MKNTYERVVPYFEKNIKKHLKENKNIILSAHGNTIRALAKKIFNISDQSINLLEIPTGNPLIIDFNNSGKFECENEEGCEGDDVCLEDCPYFDIINDN